MPHWYDDAADDPGPCPVDDAPHTTCTSPDYVTSPVGTPPQRATAAARRPLVLDPPPVPVPDRSVVEVSTKTYRGRPRPGRQTTR